MILVLIPLAGIALGVGLWALLRGLGALNIPGGDPGGGSRRGDGGGGGWSRSPTYSAPTSLRERIEDLPQGCLFAVIGVAGIWILGWVILLLVGLSLLT